MTTFTPWQSLIGGLLIGFSTLLLIRWLGKVAGISSIVGQLWSSKPDDRGWRLAFVIGLLVGFGTRLGSGCTSGHGVCGLSRLSFRSLVATLTFMLVAIVVVWVTRHLLNS
jgi:uncharacterized protein